jgi:hypothetical protein
LPSTPEAGSKPSRASPRCSSRVEAVGSGLATGGDLPGAGTSSSRTSAAVIGNFVA